MPKKTKPNYKRVWDIKANGCFQEIPLNRSARREKDRKENRIFRADPRRMPFVKGDRDGSTGRY